VLTLEDASGPPLGLFADLTYDQATVTLVPRDLLVLYTDGITEAMNERGEQFGLGRFDGVLVHCGMNAQSVLDAMIDAVSQHTGDRPADDDRTLLVGRVI
jgi:sigma-B regulation protein RsbU (phosphoserine phosphatase)